MKRGELPRSYGPQGPAQVTVGKHSVKVVMASTHVSYELPLDAVPEELLNGAFKSGMLRASFSEDNAKLIGVSPWTGRVLAKVANFGGKDNLLPTPKHENRDGHKKDGTPYPRDFLKWSANAEVTSPDALKGMNVFCPFLYYGKKNGGFAMDEETHMTILVGNSKDVQKLDSFLQAVGLGEMEIPWSENILPTLLDQVLRINQEFAINLVEGWPVSYEAIIQSKPVRSSKKTAAKKAPAKRAK